MHKNICLQPNHKPILKTTNQISRQSNTKLGVRNPTQTKLITKTKFYIACKTNKTKLSSKKKNKENTSKIKKKFKTSKQQQSTLHFQHPQPFSN
jgi:hypothetical protein